MVRQSGATPVTDATRLAEVRRYEILDGPADAMFDRIARAAATACGTAMAAVGIVDVDRVWFAARQGLGDITQVGVEPGLGATAFLADGVHLVNDAAGDPRTADHPLVRGEPWLRFYAGAAIVTDDGHRLGTVEVLDVVPRELTTAQTAVLTDLAALAAQHLEIRLGALLAVRAERQLAKDVLDVTEKQEVRAERGRVIAQTERDATAQRLQHTRRLESLGQLAGGVAHDFNNIIAVIGSYVELAIETLGRAAPSPAELHGVRADLIQVSRAAERAARLTKQLVAFGRRDIIRAEVLCLNGLIRDCEQMVRRTLGERVTLVTDLDPGLHPVHADPGRIEQILVNLAVNAREAMPVGGILSIDTTNVPGSEARARFVRVRVADTGRGMSPEVRERAFEPFFTTKPQGTGTGLGLATVYGITLAAGGNVQVHSEPGAGATITILLPAADDPGLAQLPGPGLTGAPDAA
jgi:signal transduction histidine kinase